MRYQRADPARYEQTPGAASVARLGASVSFHITITFPADFASLDTLNVEAARFRVVLAPSFAALEIANLEVTTSDAPIILSSVRCGRAKLHNENNLDPNKGALKNFEDLISGSIVQAERIDLMCENGPISGSFRASGAIVAHTTNFAIKGDFDASSLRLSTTNAEMSGSFRAKRDIVMTNAHGKVEGEFHAPLGCQIKGQYVAIRGSFEVGSELKVRHYALFHT